ncbi:MAG: MBL fold metallo-hydrolase [Planctomycetota bacterium]|nr:MBL fold metallo-hydrolase [Planctomycetota bacterium]
MTQAGEYPSGLFADIAGSADADFPSQPHPLPPAPPRRRARPPLPAQTLGLCVLGSGSGGNSAVVRLGEGPAVMIDAGFGPVTTAKRLHDAGLTLDDVRAICLTHLDQDHFRPTWIATLVGFGIPVYVHRWHVEDLRRVPGSGKLFGADLVRVFDAGEFEPVPGVRVANVRLAHDRQGTCGYVLSSDVGSVGYATDLGHVSDELIERFTGVEVLALESNYDPPMQLRSTRPLALKRRIMGPAGHLSNQQSFEAIRRIVDRSPPQTPRHIVLLHRSQQCNDPEVVRAVFAEDGRIAPRVTLTHLRRVTRWFHASPPPPAVRNQLMFGF